MNQTPIVTDRLDAEARRLGVDLSDSRAVARAIRAALSMRSTVRWRVTCGRGTAYGWIYIMPPTSIPEEDRCVLRPQLATLLGLGSVSCPETVPAARDYRAEFLARARGERPAFVGTPYWD